MAREVSTGIRAFVKDSLNQYYKRFQVKLDDNPSKNSQKSAIKIHNDGSIYVYDVGNYTGSVFDNASTLQEVIKAIGQGHGTRVEAGDNIQVDSTETTSTISALGYTYNSEKNSFAELNSNTAVGLYSHAEGNNTTASGEDSHAEGFNTKTLNFAEHAEGQYNQSHAGKTIHSIGIGNNNLTRKNAIEIMNDGSIYVYGLGNYDGSTLANVSTLQQIIENSGGGEQVYYAGNNIEITQDNSINALGYTYNSTNKSITIGYNNGGHILTNGNGAFAGGYVTGNSSIESKKDGAFSYGVAYDGGHILTNGNGAFVAGFAQGVNSTISSINASANGAFIFGVASRGGTITANTPGVFINGYADGGTFNVTGEGAHAEGYTIGITKVEGLGAHAEGYVTSASQKRVKGSGAHAEGYATTEGMDASGAGAHAEGINTHALNSGAHAEGSYTYANNYAEHAEGKYNYSHENQTIHSIGIGESEQTRKNAFEVMQDGSIYVYGLGNYDGSTLINASTLQDICNSKANKIVNATIDNFVSLNMDGNLQDSGKNPADFALVNHSHNNIASIFNDTRSLAVVTTKIDQLGNPTINLGLAIEGPGLKTVDISIGNIDNLNRALEVPVAPTQGSDSLSTSGQIYETLQNYESKLPVLSLVLEKDSQGNYPATTADLEALQDFVSVFPNNKTIPCEVYIDGVRTPAIISRIDRRIGQGPVRHFVHLSFRNRLYTLNPSITTDNYWGELNERGEVVTEFTLVKDKVGYYKISKKQALIDLRDIVEEGYSSPCRVTVIVADGQSDIIRALVDGYINWRETSTADIYEYTLLVYGNIFTCQSADAELGNTSWTKSPF